jgi:hypothetical protein
MKKYLFVAVLLFANVAIAQTNAPKCRLITTNPPVLDMVFSVQSKCLMTNAEFRQAFGDRLIFKHGLQLEAFRYFELHPCVIEALQIDVNTLARAQDELDAKNKAWDQVRASQVQAFLQSQQLFISSQLKMEEDAKKAQAAAVRQAWEDSLRERAVQNDTTRAQAAMKQADAYSSAVGTPQSQPQNQTTVIVH